MRLNINVHEHFNSQHLYISFTFLLKAINKVTLPSTHFSDLKLE